MSEQLDMAIEILDQQAHISHENQQIHAAKGMVEQAALDQRVFESRLDAIERLKGSSK